MWLEVVLTIIIHYELYPWISESKYPSHFHPSNHPPTYLIFLPPFHPPSAFPSSPLSPSLSFIYPPIHPSFHLSTLPSLHAVIHLPVHQCNLNFTRLSTRAGSKSLKTSTLVLRLLCVLEIIPWETSPEPFASAGALVWNPTSEVEHYFEKTKVVCLHSYMITSFYSMLWVWV